MKNRLYDYSGFSLKKINDPKYRHILLLLGWVWYMIMYALTENLIPASKCHVVHSVVDDMIPFVEYFVLAYVFWYLLVVGSLLYFFLFDVESFKRLQIYIIVTQVVAMIAYIAWPSVQNLRPDVFPRENFCTWLLGIIYAVDTPTGVCPSLHVAYSLGIASTWLKRRESKWYTKLAIVIVVIIICMAVNFVKQHSFVDVVMAIPVCVLAEFITFHKSYWLPKWKSERELTR